MNKAILISTVLLLEAIAACGGGESPAGCDVTAELALTGDPVAGETVFNNTCAAPNCHGADGNSSTTGATNMSEGVPGKTLQQLAETVKCGKKTMAAQSFLTPQQIADVIQYEQDTFGP
jgi:mono/diheme cytochrome c family protein